MKTKTNFNTRKLTAAALMTAVLCVLGPISLPIGPVPVSLATLGIYLAAYVLDPFMAVAACFVYILAGAIGLPVFSGFSGGVAKLVGPTGGYIAGYIPMLFVGALLINKFWKNRIISIIALEASTWILYLLGTLWLCHVTGMDFKAGLFTGVIPFLLVDLLKIVIAAIMGPEIRKRTSFIHVC